MFFWIGVLVVSVAILYLSFRLLRLVHLSSRKRHYIVWFVSMTAAIFIVTLIAGISFLMVSVFAMASNPYAEKSPGFPLHLPLVSFDATDVQDLAQEYPGIVFNGLNKRIADLDYGFTDLVSARVYKVQHPEWLIESLEKSPHEQRVSSSLFYEKMLCGAGGDLVMHWSVSAEHLQDYFTFCDMVFSKDIEIIEIVFPINDYGSSLSVSRFGKTEFFIITACERCN